MRLRKTCQIKPVGRDEVGELFHPVSAATSPMTSWAGGGIVFESCVNTTSFASVRFTATLSAGSLAVCTWQVQLQTQDQRASTDLDPTGGTCAANCYAYPAVVLAPPGAGETAYDESFELFSTPSGSNIETEIVGVQWQVTSASP
jgi:hypothetical protein